MAIREVGNREQGIGENPEPYTLNPTPYTLYPSPSTHPPIHSTAFAQPALFALEYALAQLWLAWGIEPAGVMGHSIGEYVAACIAGCLAWRRGCGWWRRGGG